MKSFIEEVANILISESSDFSQLEIIVPNQRTGLFLKKAIIEKCEKVCWMPKISTISDVFFNNSNLHQAEELLLIYKLYSIYVTCTGSKENFDDFYYWGEIILNDFDDIDKYLVDASKLFSTISDIKEIDSRFESYQEEEIEIIKRFWIHINDSKLSAHKQKFLDLWQKMNEIYTGFRTEILGQNIAYSGLIYRNVAEKIESCIFDKEEYAVVGFNALNKCEKKLLSHLKSIKQVKFFWDADKYYIDNEFQEAGKFLRENIRKYPPYRNIGIVDSIKPLKKNIEVITAPSPVSQVKLIETILTEWKSQDDYKPEKTAIVLGDENLLIPLMNSLPPFVEPYNVSMGFPIKNSSAFAFIFHLVSLRKRCRQNSDKCNFYFKDVVSLLDHTFVSSLFKNEAEICKTLINTEKLIYLEADLLSSKHDFFTLLFAREIYSVKEISIWIKSVCKEMLDKISQKEEFVIDAEFLNKILSRLLVLDDCIVTGQVEINQKEIYFRLLLNSLRSLSIAFEGEPLQGMQVLGFLETRCLDFDRIIMLSVNEGVFPKKSASQSLIPYNLRRFYKLPSIEYQDSIFAYYFYRLLQRSKEVKILYSAQSGETSSEVSRFISQIKYELGQDITFRNDGYQISISTPKPLYAKKTRKVTEKIAEILTKGISPKAINKYLNCPFSFYLEYVEEIREPRKLEEEEDGAFFGRLFHEIMRILYEPYLGKVLEDQMFNIILENRNIQSAKMSALKTVFGLKSQPEMQRYENKLIVDIVLKYVMAMINYDRDNGPLTLVSLEQKHNCELFFCDTNTNETQKVKIAGIIDRVDIHNGTHRVLDYKTGKIVQKVKSVDMLFEKNRKTELNTITQILLYAMMISRDTILSVCPGVVNINELSKDYNFRISIGDVEITKFDNLQNQSDFILLLGKMFSELVNDKIGFHQTENIKTCVYCPYKNICDK